ncbi:CRISPR-associated endonuclease Cas2 [Leptolyngbya sp. 'hensonii']|uniref:CRISPR-associated endonuclease Cas2 n=1 Tax=Leptolyngbya sp. 'hensonii' TaxID=1922337 RepID=UPI00094F808A|nr:CRISPR-associated endonuclease Cas2 [Leptolyngbya sp. 'hensonii']OLP19163.1 CRISPR-associated endonuclease Cas2 [Leptolyngbya sp. 'hensonii']
MTALWLVCYDVTDDKRRQRLVKRLEQRCQRVQYSVFECPLDEPTLAQLLENSWLPVLKLSEDSLRAYPLDAIARDRTKVYGSPPPYEPPDYIVL